MIWWKRWILFPVYFFACAVWYVSAPILAFHFWLVLKFRPSLRSAGVGWRFFQLRIHFIEDWTKNPKYVEFMKKNESRLRVWARTHGPDEKVPVVMDEHGNFQWVDRKSRRTI